MKKILIIIVLLFLVGCANDYPDYTDDVSITLNITSEVNPIITPSRGEGIYDETSKKYTLKVSTVATVDISLSYEGYETLTLSFSSTELLQGDITKDVEFIHPHRAKVVLELKTSAPTNEILIEEHEYTNKGNIFTFLFPNRQVNTNIKVSAPGYQNITIPITPEKLIVGYYNTKEILPKDDEVLIKYQKVNNQTIDFYNFSNREYISPSLISDQIIYIFKKGDEVIYYDTTLNNNVYFKADQSKEIFPFGPLADKYYSVDYKDREFFNSYKMYYEYENRRYIASVYNDYLEDAKIYKTNIPIGSKILYQSNNMIAYKKEIEENELITLNEEAFYNLEPFILKVKLYDVYNNVSVDSYIFRDNENYATGDYFYFSFSDFESSNYYIENNDLLLQEFIDDQWITSVNVIPKEDGIIYKFEDIDGNPILFDNLDYLVKEYPFSSNFIIDQQSSIDYENRQISYYYRNYLLNFDRIEIDGKRYYTITDPIVLKTDQYQLTLYFDISIAFADIEIVYNKNWFFEMPPGPHTYDVKKNDTLTIRVNDYSESKIAITYQSTITLTEELLKKGIAKFDDHGNYIEALPSFEFQLGEGVEIIDILLSHPYYYIEDGKVYYLYDFEYFTVNYKIGEETHFNDIPFDPETLIYIIE